MTDIRFTEAELAIIVAAVQEHFTVELRQDIDRFDAEALIRFFSEEVGNYFYNRGLYDAQTILEQRNEEIRSAILDLEKPTEFLR